MFFLLSKILLFLIAPLTWTIFFILRSIFLKDQKRKLKSLRAAFFILLFFSNTFIFDCFMRTWEVKAIPESKIENYDAAILLIGMTSYDIKNYRLEFNDRTDRLMQAIHLYKEQRIKKMILCGGPATLTIQDEIESTQLRNYLLTVGISDTDIIIENTSKNTHENAKNIKPILDMNFQNGKFLLITSGWHLRRATAVFIKEGIKVTPYSTDRYSGPVKFQIDYLIIPSSETLFNWEKLIHEWVGTVSYFLARYI